MLSSQGNAVLSELYADHRIEYLNNNPGSNENDVERAFLYYVYSGMNEGTHYVPGDLQEKIEKIR